MADDRAHSLPGREAPADLDLSQDMTDESRSRVEHRLTDVTSMVEGLLRENAELRRTLARQARGRSTRAELWNRHQKDMMSELGAARDTMEEARNALRGPQVFALLASSQVGAMIADLAGAVGQVEPLPQMVMDYASRDVSNQAQVPATLADITATPTRAPGASFTASLLSASSTGGSPVAHVAASGLLAPVVTPGVSRVAALISQIAATESASAASPPLLADGEAPRSAGSAGRIGSDVDAGPPSVLTGLSEAIARLLHERMLLIHAVGQAHLEGTMHRMDADGMRRRLQAAARPPRPAPDEDPAVLRARLARLEDQLLHAAHALQERGVAMDSIFPPPTPTQGRVAATPGTRPLGSGDDGLDADRDYEGGTYDADEGEGEANDRGADDEDDDEDLALALERGPLGEAFVSDVHASPVSSSYVAHLKQAFLDMERRASAAETALAELRDSMHARQMAASEEVATLRRDLEAARADADRQRELAAQKERDYEDGARRVGEEQAAAVRELEESLASVRRTALERETELESREARRQQDLATITREHAQQAGVVDALESRTQELAAERDQLNERVGELESELQTALDRVSALQRDADSRSPVGADDEGEPHIVVTELRRRVQDLEDSLSRARTQASDAQAEVRDVRAQSRARESELEASLAGMRSENQSLVDTQERQRADMARLQDALERVRSEASVSSETGARCRTMEESMRAVRGTLTAILAPSESAKLGPDALITDIVEALAEMMRSLRREKRRLVSSESTLSLRVAGLEQQCARAERERDQLRAAASASDEALARAEQEKRAHQQWMDGTVREILAHPALAEADAVAVARGGSTTRAALTSAIRALMRRLGSAHDAARAISTELARSTTARAASTPSKVESELRRECSRLRERTRQLREDLETARLSASHGDQRRHEELVHLRSEVAAKASRIQEMEGRVSALRESVARSQASADREDDLQARLASVNGLNLALLRHLGHVEGDYERMLSLAEGHRAPRRG